MTYRFKYPTDHDHEMDTLSPDQLQRLEYIDRLLDDPQTDHDPYYLKSMTDDQLRDLVNMLPDQHKSAPPVTPRTESRIPVHGYTLVRRERCPFPAPVRYKAQIWYQQRNCDLGWYMSESVRDEVVAEAKMLRNMGLDPRIAKRKPIK